MTEKQQEAISKELAVLNNLQIGTFVMQKDELIVFWNVYLENQTGIKRKDIEGKKITEYFPDIFKSSALKGYLNSVFDEGRSVTVPVDDNNVLIPVRDASGAIRSQETVMSPISFSGIDEKMVLIVLRDVTDLTRFMEQYERLKENTLLEIAGKNIIEENYKRLIQTIPDIIYEVDTAGRFVFISDAIKKLGYAPGMLIGKMFTDILHPDSIDAVSRDSVLPKYKGKSTGDVDSPKLFDERRTGDRMTLNLEVKIVKNGWKDPSKDYRYVELASSGKWDTHKDGSKRLVGSIGIMRDITTRKEAETALHVFSSAIEQSPAEVMITDKEGKILFVNSRFTQLTGYDIKEVIGKTPAILKSGELPQNTYDDLWKTVNRGKEWRGELQNKRKDGTLYWEYASMSAIKDRNGNIINYLKVAEDITERKKAEKILADTKDALQAKTWGLEKTNEAVKELYKELEIKNRDLQKLDKLKSEFVSTVSHELRTPLAITKEGISLVLDGIVGEITAKQKKILDSAKNNIERLARIINDLLDISRIEAGKLSVKKEKVNLVDLIKIVTDSFREKAKAKGLEIKADISVESITVFADPDRIIQVFTNLFGNALKFTEQGYIQVSVCEAGDYIECSVSDSGRGMTTEEINKVFDKFQQFGISQGPGEKGTGLGLPIAKNIIELHEGQIHVISKVNKGTTFSFTLPAFKSPKAVCYQMVREQCENMQNTKGTENFTLLFICLSNIENIKASYGIRVYEKVLYFIKDTISHHIKRSDDKVELYDADSIMVLLPHTDTKGARFISESLRKTIGFSMLEIDGHHIDVKVNCGIACFPEDGNNQDDLVMFAQNSLTKKRKILIVDDHPQIVRLLTYRIESDKRFDCVQAFDGEMALEKISETKPDLIICDIMMPKMNGYELLGRLKANADTRDIPVIILTAYKVDETKIQSYVPSEAVVSKTEGFDKIMSLMEKFI